MTKKKKKKSAADERTQRTQQTRPDRVDKHNMGKDEQASVQHSFLDYGVDKVLLEPVCQLLQILDLDPQDFILLLELGCPLLHLNLLLLASHPRAPRSHVVLDPHF